MRLDLVMVAENDVNLWKSNRSRQALSMFPLFSIQNLSPDYASSPKRFPKKEVRLRQVPVLPGNPLGGLGNPLGGFGDLAASPKPKLESNVLPERGAGYVVSF